MPEGWPAVRSILRWMQSIQVDTSSGASDDGTARRRPERAQAVAMIAAAFALRRRRRPPAEAAQDQQDDRGRLGDAGRREQGLIGPLVGRSRRRTSGCSCCRSSPAGEVAGTERPLARVPGQREIADQQARAVLIRGHIRDPDSKQYVPAVVKVSEKIWVAGLVQEPRPAGAAAIGDSRSCRRNRSGSAA